MSFYLIRNKQVSWGDYGNIIVYGFISKEGTEIIVERTAPFVPSVYSYNKYIAIVDSLKEGIESLNFKGISFNKTKKKKIIELDWQKWDINEPIPVKPKSGEPEDFILKGKHIEQLAESMEDIWVMIPHDTAKGIIDKSKKELGSYAHISLDVSEWDGSDIFRTPQLGHVFCTERFMNAIAAIPNNFLNFIPISSV